MSWRQPTAHRHEKNNKTSSGLTNPFRHHDSVQIYIRQSLSFIPRQAMVDFVSETSELTHWRSPRFVLLSSRGVPSRGNTSSNEQRTSCAPRMSTKQSQKHSLWCGTTEGGTTPTGPENDKLKHCQDKSLVQQQFYLKKRWRIPMSRCTWKPRANHIHPFSFLRDRQIVLLLSFFLLFSFLSSPWNTVEDGQNERLLRIPDSFRAHCGNPTSAVLSVACD